MTSKLSHGPRYRVLRLLHNLSQRDVNKAVHKSSTWCSQLEREITSLTVEQALKLSKLYHVTLDQLLGVEPIEVTILKK